MCLFNDLLRILGLERTHDILYLLGSCHVQVPLVCRTVALLTGEDGITSPSDGFHMLFFKTVSRVSWNLLPVISTKIFHIKCCLISRCCHLKLCFFDGSETSSPRKRGNSLDRWIQRFPPWPFYQMSRLYQLYPKPVFSLEDLSTTIIQ